jgi:tetratricopeptide (TPR) repeat protein
LLAAAAITVQPPSAPAPLATPAISPALLPDLQNRSLLWKMLRQGCHGLLAVAGIIGASGRAGCGKLHALATGEQRRFYLPVILGGTVLALLLMVIGVTWAWNALTPGSQSARWAHIVRLGSGPPGASTDNIPQPSVARRQRQAWYQATVVEAYDRHGKKDSRWDAAARAALQVSLPHWDAPTWIGDFTDRAWTATKKAIDLGCDDPLISYWYARLGAHALSLTAAEVDRYYTQAALGMKNSRYPPSRKAMAYAYAAVHKAVNPALTPKDADAVFALLDDLLALLPDIARNRSIPGQEAYLICHVAEEVYRKMLGGDRKAAIDRIAGVLQKDPACEPLLRAFLGPHLVKWAWDARSAAWAKDVRPEQWKLFGERLDLAEVEFNHALRLDPANPVIPTQMITLELGQGRGKARMETIYKKAIELDPDNLEACRAKIYYLEPKWYGSNREMLEFGRQCRDTGNWEASLPMVLIDAHEALARYVQPPEAYFQQPGVWDDIRSVFETRLKRHPELRYERSEFAKWAVLCGQFAEAHRQFQTLGNNYSRGTFPNPQEYQLLRQVAAQRAGR